MQKELQNFSEADNEEYDDKVLSKKNWTTALMQLLAYFGSGFSTDLPEISRTTLYIDISGIDVERFFIFWIFYYL